MKFKQTGLLVSLIIFGLNGVSFGQNADSRKQLMQEIQSTSCDNKKVNDLLKKVKVDAVIFSEMVKYNCLPLKELYYENSDIITQTTKVAFTYFNENTKPKAKNVLSKGEDPFKDKEIYKIAYTMGFINGLIKRACEDVQKYPGETHVTMKLDNGKDISADLSKISQLCNLLPSSKAIIAEGMMWSSGTNDLVENCRKKPTTDCVHQVMTKQISFPRREWIWHEPGNFILTQLVERQAIFVDSNDLKNDYIAFEQKTLQNQHHLQLQKNDSLRNILLQLGDYCAKFVSEGMLPTSDGFERHAYYYTAVECSKRK